MKRDCCASPRRFMVCAEPYDPEVLVMVCLDCGEAVDLFGPGDAEDEAAGAFGYPGGHGARRAGDWKGEGEGLP